MSSALINRKRFHFVALLVFFLGLGLSASSLFADGPNPNNNDDCNSPNADKCKCGKGGGSGPGSGGKESDGCGCNSAASSTNQSLGYSIPYGIVPFEPSLGQGVIFMHQEVPTPTQFTPQVVRYGSVITSRVLNQKTSAADWEFELRKPDGLRAQFKFSSGQSVAPDLRKEYTLRLLSSNRLTIPAGLGNTPPAFVRLESNSGWWLELNAATGRPTVFQSASGRLIDLSAIPSVVATHIVEQDDVIRQIKIPAGLADIVATGDQQFEIRFYTNDQVGAFDTQISKYPVSGQAFRLVRVQNGSTLASDYGNVKITETWGSRVNVTAFVYNETLKEWALSLGEQAERRVESKSSAPGPGANETTITRVLKNEQDQVVSTHQEVKRAFPWGQEVVREIHEPATLNLVTEYTYHETSGLGGYSKQRTVLHPTGRWEAWTYDTQDRVTEYVAPWKDSPLSSFPTGARVIAAYAYVSLDAADVVKPSDDRPRTITKSIVAVAGAGPEIVERTWHVYRTDSNGVYSEIEERAASESAVFGAAGNLRTTSVYYTTKATQSGYDAVAAGRLHYTDKPDGTRTTYLYTLTSGNLNAYFMITEILATTASPAGVDGLSTKKETIHNDTGAVSTVKSYIRSSGAWHLVSTEQRTTNVQGFHVATHVDGRQTYAATYDAHLLSSASDASGTTKVFSYDSLGKIDSETRVGAAASGSYAAQSDITTTYLRELGGLDCGCDGEVTATTSAGGFVSETKTKKDAEGRITYSKDSFGLETTYAYVSGGRERTETRPDGGIVTELKWLDGRIASVTGTGVVAEYQDYGVNADGTTWTKVSKLAANGERWEKTTKDLLGRVVKTERPTYDGGVLTTTYAYNTKGLLVRERQRHISGSVETTLIADTLTEYDAMGNVSRTGLDMDADGTLGLASVDRVTDIVGTFAFHGSAWWRIVQTKVYPVLNSASAVQVSETRKRLSGLSATLAAETVQIDIDGNIAWQKVQTDFAQKLLTKETKSAESAQPAKAIYRNGLLVSESTASVALTLYGYDDLGRRNSVRNPRHELGKVATFTYLDGGSRVLTQTDAAGHTTTYDYYPTSVPGAGNVRSVIDAGGNTRRYAYDLLRRLTRQWGSAEYPQAYSYTAHGELQTLTTWRDTGAANLNQTTWPALGGGDVTTWVYQASTGLLTRKQYADGQGTDYAYDKFDRLATRTWARTSSFPAPGSLLTTTYSYAAGAGQLETINYSDDTPDVGNTYDRLGRSLAVTDVTGTRSFAYDPAKLRLDTEVLPAGFYGTRVLKRDYQGGASGEIPGRVGGYQLGTVADPDQDFAVSYAYDGFGRLNGVTSPAGAYVYGFAANSDLLATITGPVYVATRTYEPNRDVVDILENTVGTTSVSKFDYTVNAVGQRAGRAQSGSAFVQTSTDIFGYNTKGEVTGATNATLPTSNQGFVYDEIGNRSAFTSTAGTISYKRNELNQYTEVSAFVSQPTYDFDGNQKLTGLGQVYHWDAENRLVAVEPVLPANGDRKVVNVYDAQSRRVRRQVFVFTGGAWGTNPTIDEKFVYDGWSVVAVLNADSGNAVLRTYTWGKDVSGSIDGAGGVGGLLAVKDGAAVYHYTYDANGNVSEVLSNSGSVVAHYEYAPFGDIVVASGAYASANEYRFSTKPWDSASGLYYYGFRYYNPSTGRWPNRDPIEQIKGKKPELLPEGPNLYAYVGNRPLDYADPLGLAYGLGQTACCDGKRYAPGTHCCQLGNVVAKELNWKKLGYDGANACAADLASQAANGNFYLLTLAGVTAGIVPGGDKAAGAGAVISASIFMGYCVSTSCP